MCMELPWRCAKRIFTLMLATYCRNATLPHQTNPLESDRAHSLPYLPRKVNSYPPRSSSFANEKRFLNLQIGLLGQPSQPAENHLKASRIWAGPSHTIEERTGSRIRAVCGQPMPDLSPAVQVAASAEYSSTFSFMRPKVLMGAGKTSTTLIPSLNLQVTVVPRGPSELVFSVKKSDAPSKDPLRRVSLAGRVGPPKSVQVKSATADEEDRSSTCLLHLASR